MKTDDLETNLSKNGLKDYIRTIKKVPPATKEENVALINRVRSGDSTAREEMVEKNLGLVISSAFQNHRKVELLEVRDLISEGQCGLLRAIETYDPELGSFSTYAIPWINQAINRAIDNFDKEVRRPSYFIQKKSAYLKYIDTCKKEGSPIADDDEICEMFDFTKSMLSRIRKDAELDTVSLFSPLGDNDDDRSLEETVSNDGDHYEKLENKIEDLNILAYLKLNLSKRDYYVLYYKVFFTREVLNEELGPTLGISGERVRQIQENNLKRLRKIYESIGNFSGKLDPLSKKLVQNEAFNVLPIRPSDIITFLFMRDKLTDLEKEIYKDLYFSNAIFHPSFTAMRLNITREEVEDALIVLRKKIDNEKFSNGELFKGFTYAITSELKSSILEADLNMDIGKFLKNYSVTARRWQDKSFEDVLELASLKGIDIEPKEMLRLQEYFDAVPTPSTDKSRIEAKLNALIFGFLKDDKIPTSKLYKTFLENEDEFTDKQRDVANYIFGKMSRKEVLKRYPDIKLIQMKIYVYDKLCALYLGIDDYKSVHITKDIYLTVRTKGGLSFEDVKILDLYFGISEKRLSAVEIGERLGYTLEEANNLIEDAKRRTGSLYLDLSNTMDIDIALYREYLAKYYLEFEEPTESIVQSFFFRNKSYKEISSELNVTPKRITEAIQAAVRTIDARRFGIILEPVYEREFTIDAIESTFKGKNRSAALDLIDNSKEEVKAKYGLTKKQIIDLKNKIQLACRNAASKDVELSEGEILKEVLAPSYTNVLTIKMRKIISLYYGFKNLYNVEGMKCTLTQIADLLGVRYSSCLYNFNSGLLYIKAKKIKLYKSSLDYVDRSIVVDAMKDVHLPLSIVEKRTLELFYGLNDQNSLSLEEISSITKERPESIRRRIKTAVTTIMKYRAGEIKGSISFQADVEPFLRFFPKRDQAILTDIYRDEISFENTSKKYDIPYGKFYCSITNMRIRLKFLQDKPQGLDFDYFYEEVHSPFVPYYSDKDLALELFCLYYEKGFSYKEISEQFHPELTKDMVAKIILNISIAVMKRKSGIKKVEDFSYEEVRSYYLANHENMSLTVKKRYYNYFRSFKSTTLSKKRRTSIAIIGDLLKEREGYVSLRKDNVTQLKPLLMKYRKHFSHKEFYFMLSVLGISSREFMRGKDKRQVLDFLFELEYGKPKAFEGIKPN